MTEKFEYIIVGVNYAAFKNIITWSESARRQCPNARLIIVDNFSSNEESHEVESFCKSSAIEYISCENIGYGSALNVAVEQIKLTTEPNSDENYALLLGNIDVVFHHLPAELPSSNIFMSCATENGRLLNPFLTISQTKGLLLHDLAARYDSKVLLVMGICLLKLLSLVSSPGWTLHGSMFSFDLKLVGSEPIFNDQTFLYSEELEFGSWIETNGYSIAATDIRYEHAGGVSTYNYRASFSKFFGAWKRGYINWRKRWALQR